MNVNDKMYEIQKVQESARSSSRSSWSSSCYAIDPKEVHSRWHTAMKCVSPFYVVRDSNWVPCGKCNFCLKKARAWWSFRLYQQLKAADTAAFITLTYDDFAIPEFGGVSYDLATRLNLVDKVHVQKFLKRLRHHDMKIGRGKRTLVYYAVAERGDLGRGHYHMLLYNAHMRTLARIAEIWQYGGVHVGKVEPASIAYVSGYVINRHNDDGTGVRPFALMSKGNGGIGSSYLTPQMKRWHKRGKRNYAMMYGYKVPLPRLYKDKIFSSLEKKVMGIQMEQEMDKRYASEIERLSFLEQDPHAYYQEKVNQAYASVKTLKGRF